MRNVIERILNLLAFLLTVERPVTAAEIRTTVAGYEQESDEAFRRTFERDKELLRHMGIPLERRPTDAWEVEFGYVLPREQYALEDPGLTDEERAALLLAAQAVRIGGQVTGPGAILKLGGSPLQTGGDVPAADLGLSSEVLGDAFSAVSARRTLTFVYSGRNRLVHPYGLVHRRGHWYVVGPETGDLETVKAFRLDRAQSIEVGGREHAFERPRGFRAAEATTDAPWESGAPELVAELEFDAEMAWIAERQLSARSAIHHRDDGTITAEVPVSAVDSFLGWVMTFDDKVVIAGPPELRAEYVDRVRGSA
jgi:predicted DNA-binding transcriptional regulator YafY